VIHTIHPAIARAKAAEIALAADRRRRVTPPRRPDGPRIADRRPMLRRFGIQVLLRRAGTQAG
jgi:hypothetical protein